MCQARPTGLYTKWELDSDSGKHKPPQNKTRSFENIFMLYFQRVKPPCEMKSFYTMGTQKKLMHTVLMAFVDTATLCFKLWDINIIIAHVKKLDFLSLRRNSETQ